MLPICYCLNQYVHVYKLIKILDNITGELSQIRTFLQRYLLSLDPRIFWLVKTPRGQEDNHTFMIIKSCMRLTCTNWQCMKGTLQERKNLRFNYVALIQMTPKRNHITTHADVDSRVQYLYFPNSLHKWWFNIWHTSSSLKTCMLLNNSQTDGLACARLL